ncbi:MAG TPA: Hsp20/alpha crystallin family protein [Chloroflexota bacterium]|nr:Hsp20/alpha crystallin family protein [Chloroflexota bacterium]
MSEAQLPVKVYQSAERVTVAAPMPGLEPTDIRVRVTDDGHIVLHGQRRAHHPDTRTLVVDEWTPGPYERTLALPCPVDGPLADVTYGNGVLVVALPKAARVRAAELEMIPIGGVRGQRVGSRGKGITPTTTEAHRQAQAAMNSAG